MPGSRWRANFYKCGDKTSHPHWGSWQALDILIFHQPESFGILEFDGQQT
ncbi:MAG: carbohydrate-binding family 9-like protein [Candidatus Marinimicrobia bacterium]|nr:carbohydrate-binding family 9-like protein [Candidatus Neomarinimicrobiota bacterium]